MIAGVTAGSTVFWPAGRYLVTAAIPAITKSMTWLGAGRLATTIVTNQASTNLFTFKAAVNISEMGFTCSVTPTSGYMLTYNSGATRFRLERYWMVTYFNGININGPSDIMLIDGQMFGQGAGATSILYNGGEAALFDGLVIQQGVRPGSGNGIAVVNGGITINNCQILACGTCLNLMPGNGQAVVSMWVMNTGFDNALNGILFQPTGTGGIARNWFIGCWMSSMDNSGVTMISTGLGSINGCEFNNCHVLDNAMFGFNITDNETLNLSWLDCKIAGNTQEGISFFAGGQNFSITDCRIGAYGIFPDNVAGGINLGGPCTFYQICDNNLGGSNVLVGAGVQTGSAPGANEFINGNIGYVSQNRGGANITAGQTSVTVAHGLSGTPALTDIVVSCLTGMGNPPQAIPFVISPNSSTFVIEIGIPLAFTTAFTWWAKLPCTG